MQIGKSYQLQIDSLSLSPLPNPLHLPPLSLFAFSSVSHTLSPFFPFPLTSLILFVWLWSDILFCFSFHYISLSSRQQTVPLTLFPHFFSFLVLPSLSYSLSNSFSLPPSLSPSKRASLTFLFSPADVNQMLPSLLLLKH